MANDQVRLRGVDELVSGSRRLFDRIGDAAGKAFEQTAQDAADVIQAQQPRRTGALAGAVISRRDGERAQVGIDKAGVPYAGWIEFGGGSRPGRPYVSSGRTVFPTAMPIEPDLVRAGTKATEQEIRGFRWPSP